MKLAEQMRAVAGEKENVVGRLKVAIEEKLTAEAQLGADTVTYAFRVGTSAAVIREIAEWLKEEGFSLYAHNSINLQISWGRDNSVLERGERLLTGFVLGRDHVTYRLSPFDEDKDIQEAIESFRKSGYSVEYNETFREMVIRKAGS